jgi:hypothetical protein
MQAYQPQADGTPRVLHVVVGHGLTRYFLNAIRSVRSVAPADSVLIVDNASQDRELLGELKRMVDGDGLIDVIFRAENDVRQNRKVGSLYAAYEVAFGHAMARQFDFLHLIQADFQTLWWDSDFVARSAEIFAAHPGCVNISTRPNLRDEALGDDLMDASGQDGLRALRQYGLTDTGLYHLARWRAGGMRFGPSEREHARRYLNEGHEVVFHPWPTDAPIPWPAVVRNGVQRGREVVTTKPFLIKPLSAAQVAQVKAAQYGVCLEEFCIPWDWACATPMLVTDLDSIDYWVMRYRDAKKNGIRHLLPRFELRGIDPADRLKPIIKYRYRPSLFRLFVLCPTRYAVRRLIHSCSHYSHLAFAHGGMRARRRVRQLRGDRLQ